MHSWEDFAFGRKIAGAILRLPERFVLIAKKETKEMLVQARTIARMWVLVGILAILGWRAVACAQDDSQAPAGTRSLADTPFQLILPSEHLLGDWYGMRTLARGPRHHPDLDVRYGRPRQSDRRQAAKLHSVQ